MSDGSLSDQIGLLIILSNYERAQEAADLFPVEGQIAKAEELYLAMTRAALRCGYQWSRMSTVYEFAKQRAEAVRKAFPRHVQEAQRRAA